MKLSQYARQEGITYKAAWLRYTKGQIEGAYLDHSGHIFIPNPTDLLQDQAALYARVSTPTQKDDLERQMRRLEEYATARGLTITKKVMEIGSGVKSDRPKLTTLLTQERDQWGVLIVEHRDRLTRVGFDWFPTLLANEGKTILVMDEVEESDEGRMQDIFSILYAYAASEYGRRGAKNRAERAAKALAEDDQD